MNETPRTLDIHVTPKPAAWPAPDRWSRFQWAMERFQRWYDATSVVALALLAAAAAVDGRLLLSLALFAGAAASYGQFRAWRRVG